MSARFAELRAMVNDRSVWHRGRNRPDLFRAALEARFLNRAGKPVPSIMRDDKTGEAMSEYLAALATLFGKNLQQ